MQKHAIAIQTDFGTADGRAGKLTGSILRVDDTLDVCFTEHKCPRGDVMAAGTFLYNSLAFFPAGTVYVSIVERAQGGNPPCAALTHADQIILTPDNGILTIWMQNHGLKALRRLDITTAPADMNPYAYFAARLANGTLTFDELGEARPLEDTARYTVRASAIAEGFAQGGVLGVMENFGNLNLTVAIEEFERTGICFGDAVRVTLERDGRTVFDGTVPYDRSFGYAALGAPILFNGSTGYIGLGLNQESFAGKYMKDRYDHPEGIAAYDVTIRK
jgi:S-adenosylmethionine hydrolase